MNKKILVWVLIIIIIVLGLVVILQNRKNNVVPSGEEINQLVPNENTENNLGQNNVVNNPAQNVLTNNVVSDCIVVTSPRVNEKVSNIIKVSGYVNGCDNWTSIVGVAGEMVVKDENGNILNDAENSLDGNLAASNWGKKYPDNFSGNITIVKQPQTKFGILTINNENQSDNFGLDRKIEIRLDLSDVKISNTNEVFTNQPGAIKSIIVNGTNQWLLAVDLLTINTKWIPGVSDPFVNQNTKIRNLKVTNATKTYKCGTATDGTTTGPNVLQNTASFITNLQNKIAQAKTDLKNRIGGPVEIMTDWAMANFNIDGTNITAIYQQCLP